MEKIEHFKLQFEEQDEAGVRASLNDLLIEFTLDHDELVVALASRSQPDLYYAAEYVAVMLGAISSEAWAGYQRQLDEFVASNHDDVDPPAPLADADQLLSWACGNVERLHREFCHNSDSLETLEKIVDEYNQPGSDRRSSYSGPRLQ